MIKISDPQTYQAVMTLKKSQEKLKDLNPLQNYSEKKLK